MTINTFILTGISSRKVDAGWVERRVGGASALQLAVVLVQLPLTSAETEQRVRSDHVWT